MKFLLTLLIAFSGTAVWAADRQVPLTTRDGRQILLDVYQPGGGKVALLAPGAGCGPRLDMYDAIAAEAKGRGYTVVRLYWAYCVSAPMGKPSENLVREREDFLTAFRYVKLTLGYVDAQILIGGKSQGTQIAAPLFAEEKLLAGLVLLTPLCTDDELDPQNPKNVFSEEYPRLAAEIRPVLLAHGDKDQLCHRVHFEEYLLGKPGNFSTAKVMGDHGFSVRNPDGSLDAELTGKNLLSLAAEVGAWLP